MQIRGGPAAVIGDGKGKGTARPLPGFTPVGRLAQTGGSESQKTCLAEFGVTPDGKGSSIFRVELLFLSAPDELRVTKINHKERSLLTMNHSKPEAKPQNYSLPPISLRYLCDTQGQQVGLSHYLMKAGRRETKHG